MGRKGLVSVWLAIASFTSSAIPSTARAQAGIASRYPNDKNIGSDPAVIVADDFESYTDITQLSNKWKVDWIRYMSLSTSEHYAGGKSLQMTIAPTTTETAMSITKVLPTPLDTLYCRIYFKFDPGYHFATSNHNGICMKGGNYGGAGIPAPADGTAGSCFCFKTNRTWQTIPTPVRCMSIPTGRT